MNNRFADDIKKLICHSFNNETNNRTIVSRDVIYYRNNSIKKKKKRCTK